MSAVNQMLASAGAPVISSTINPQRQKDEAGLFKVDLSGGVTMTCTVQCEGRIDANAPWFVIEQLIESELQNGTGASVVALFPHMRVNLVAIGAASGTPVLSAWIVE